MKTLRIGLIGCGRRGGLASHAHRPGQDVEVAAICEINEPSWPHLRKTFGEGVFLSANLSAVLDQGLDGVLILTPDLLHEQQALRVIEAGIPVYLEKPMATSIEGCDRILAAASARNVKVFVGHNMRYMPLYRKMRSLVEAGAIGEVKAVWCRHFISYGGDAFFRDWHADASMTVSLLLQKAAHDLDVIHWLAGSFTRRVTAFGTIAVYGDLPRRTVPLEGHPPWTESNWPPSALTELNPVIDVEDLSMVLMELESGALASYQQCHFTPDSFRNYTVIGSEGRLENMGDEPTSPIMVWNRRKDAYRPQGDEIHYADTDAVFYDRAIIDEFLAYVRSGETPSVLPDAARMAVATALRATESLRSGGAALDVPACPRF